MSESGSLVTSGSSIGQSSLPLVIGGNQPEINQQSKVKVLPKLPSHRFRYSIWHELNSTTLTGDQLKAPRVRDGPEIKDKFFYKIRDDSCRRIHHTRRGADRKNYQNTTENWENVTDANLSYQELQHRYQRENFMRILKRLIRVEHLNLMHNEMVDISSVSFTCCTHLNLSTNFIETLKNLPKLPSVEELNLMDNYIHDLDGIKKLASAPLVDLNMKGNPVHFSLNYRQRVFAALPSLKILDGVPRQPKDLVFEEEPEDAENDESTCVIC